MRTRHLIALAALGVFAFAVYKVGGLLLFAVSAPEAPEKSREIVVLVRKGLGAGDLSRLLEKEGAISSASQFMRLGRYLRRWDEMKAGEYAIRSSDTPLQIFSTISSGKSITYALTFQEGINMYQIADKLEAQGLAQKAEILRLARDPQFINEMGFEKPLPPSLEGYLFPDTYHFNRTMEAKQMLGSMVRAFQNNWKKEWDERRKEFKLSQHQVVTLASLIEKETGAAHERPVISSVFHNRLKKRMRLQSDPTTIYGVWENFDGNLRRHHLKEKNPYNTYAIYGLPQGAIANPGFKALEAALYPESSSFLYFVSKNDGTHQFSETIQQHNAAVKAFQINRSARTGKSWRDLQQRPGS